jgi:hypothetical protein
MNGNMGKGLKVNMGFLGYEIYPTHTEKLHPSNPKQYSREGM